MLGFHGASGNYSPRYLQGFELECHAIRMLRDQLGFRNVVVMIPFCRIPGEADRVLDVLSEQFSMRLDGFSIRSNDLTQLTLGVDRDSGELTGLFDEQHPAVTSMIRRAIEGAHAGGIPVGLGIDSLSVSPDSFTNVKRHVVQSERRLAARRASAPEANP